ncbi:MAG TPA: hypothetical protein VFS19_03750 [Planctomycetota bacterium]|nr:hypothetical protein [Planctomycetota bacterium]
MIKINLLPLDKRKTERTPLKGVGLMIADAAILGVVVILVVIHIIWNGNLKAQIEANKKTIDSLAADVKEHDKLVAEVRQLTNEKNDLDKVTAARPFIWSEVIDGIWDCVAKHKRVWLDDIQQADGKMMDSKLKALDSNTPITGSKHGVLLKCHVGGVDVRALTAFRRELREHHTLSRYFPVVNFDVSYRKADQKEFAEKFSLDFEVFLVNTGQTTENTSPATAGRRAP